MVTIELRGTKALNISYDLVKSLDRYAKFCYNPFQKVSFIKVESSEPGTNTPLLSIPTYLNRSHVEQIKQDPFPSLDSLSAFSNLNNQGESILLNNFKSFIEKAEKAAAILDKIPQTVELEGITYDICLLNIQCRNQIFWFEELEKIYHKDNEHIFYLFYWQLNEAQLSEINNTDGSKYPTIPFIKEKKKENVIKDRIWSYSQFMRDFMKNANRSYEWEISQIENLSVDQINRLIKLKIPKQYPIINYRKEMQNNVERLCHHYEFTKGKTIDIKDIASIYLYNKSNHFNEKYFEEKFKEAVEAGTGSAHRIMKIKDNMLLHPDKVKKLGMLENVLFFNDLFKNVANACITFKGFRDELKPDFMFLDDVGPDELKKDDYKDYRTKIACFQDWFPGSSFYYSNDMNFFNYFFGESESSYWPMMIKDQELDLRLDMLSAKSKCHKNLNENSINPLFIGIDIDWNGKSYGYTLLKEFRKNAFKLKRPTFIFVFSRFEYPSTIRKSVASGALFYITKQNFMKLVPKVYNILISIGRGMNDPSKPLEIMHEKYLQYQNWNMLDKLEPEKIINLKSYVINGYPLESWDNDLCTKNHDYLWIQKLPKAELHCHIGSCLGPELLPLTALLVLSEKYQSRPHYSLQEKRVLHEQISTSIRFVTIIVKGLKLNEKGNPILYLPQLNKAFGITDSVGCLFEDLTNSLLLNEKKKEFPEEVILNPFFDEKNLPLSGSLTEDEYFLLRQKLRRLHVVYDDIILFFILLVYIKEEEISSIDFFKTKLNEKLQHLLGGQDSDSINTTINKFTHEIDPSCPDPKVDNFLSVFLGSIRFEELIDSVKKSNKGLLKRLQSAAGKSNSLFSYLRGCEYGGAPHLQTFASIYFACHFIVTRYAMPDNIRYLTLRCAVDGYTKSGLIMDQDHAMEALLRGFNYAVKGKNIHIDLILTAKRHKSFEDFRKNSELAIKYWKNKIPDERNEKGQQNTITDSIKDQEPKKNLSFFDTETEVVSFDLAGLEAGNRASKYSELFLPLLKKCFPITIHAGEEDSHEAIWEAVFEVQAQRIGHALSLRDKDGEELLKYVKNRHIAIELCPISNLLTRSADTWEMLKVENRNNSDFFESTKYYPLRHYLMENLDVTINTDNPYVSDCTLTKEFLVSASLAGGLTKWEVLRLIKNSFKSAALLKEDKKLLLNEIEDEIYSILLEEDI
jgi:adenosine deaminase